MNEPQGELSAREVAAELTGLLAGVERALRDIGCWETVAPPAEALASEIPFCHDTLAFTQWLQWIFLPRLRALLEGGLALPNACAVAPIAELSFTETTVASGPLLAHLAAIDLLLTTRRRH